MKLRGNSGALVVGLNHTEKAIARIRERINEHAESKGMHGCTWLSPEGAVKWE